MILLTVGSAFPFDRLVGAVDELVATGVVEDEVFAQIGVGGRRPLHMDSAEVLEKPRFDELLSRSSGVIAHAGMGTITMALERGKPILVVPRRKQHGELVNDHQIDSARRLEESRQVLVAYETSDLAAKLRALPTFVPAPRVSQADRVARRIGEFLVSLR